MREILFKGKVRYNGTYFSVNDWVYGSLIIRNKRVFIYVNKEDNFGNIIRVIEVEVIPETVGQFTGLKDKNKNRIFEGDATNVGEYVVFEDGIFGTTYTGNQQGISRLSQKRCEHLEIIGNIHDNPELLNK